MCAHHCWHQIIQDAFANGDGECLSGFLRRSSNWLSSRDGRRLDENWTPELQASLEAKHPALKDSHNLAMFRRKWYYMYLYMEVAYSRKWLNLVTWTFARPVSITRPAHFMRHAQHCLLHRCTLPLSQHRPPILAPLYSYTLFGSARVLTVDRGWSHFPYGLCLYLYYLVSCFHRSPHFISNVLTVATLIICFPIRSCPHYESLWGSRSHLDNPRCSIATYRATRALCFSTLSSRSLNCKLSWHQTQVGYRLHSAGFAVIICKRLNCQE